MPHSYHLNTGCCLSPYKSTLALPKDTGTCPRSLCKPKGPISTLHLPVLTFSLPSLLPPYSPIHNTATPQTMPLTSYILAPTSPAHLTSDWGSCPTPAALHMHCPHLGLLFPSPAFTPALAPVPLSFQHPKHVAFPSTKGTKSSSSATAPDCCQHPHSWAWW